MALQLNEIRERLDDLRVLAREDILSLYDKLEKGEISLEEWEQSMSALMVDFSFGSYMLGYDSEEIPESEIEKLNDYVSEQLGYLGQFAGAIAMGLTGATMSIMLGDEPIDHLKWDAWRARALSYTGALTAPFWSGVASSYTPGGTPPKSPFPWEDPDIRQSLPLPALPGDGDTLCGQWCKCEWDIHPIDEAAGDYDCYWIVDKDAEHCQTCIERAARWSPLKIRNWDIVAKDVEIATKEEEKSLIKAIVMKNLKEKIAEKGGPGSGNWGHGGLEGVWGGSSSSGSRGIPKELSVADFKRELVGAMTDLASRYDNFDEFVSDWSINNFHGLYWHLTDKEDFKINPEQSPRDMSSMAMPSSGSSGTRGLMVTTDPQNWYSSFEGKRKLAALIRVEGNPNKDYSDSTRGYGHEMYIYKPELARVVALLPYKRAVTLSRRMYDEWLPQSREKLYDIWIHALDPKGISTEELIKRGNVPLFSEKGGPGSGNYGHSGLVGVHGGSSPTKALPAFNDRGYTIVGNYQSAVALKPKNRDSYGISYWVLPDGKLLVSQNPVTEHTGILFDYLKHNDVDWATDEEKEEFFENYTRYARTFGSIPFLVPPSISKKLVRVSVHDDWVDITTRRINRSSLKRIQSLIENGKMPYDLDKEVGWNTYQSWNQYVDLYSDEQSASLTGRFTIDDLMNSSGISRNWANPYPPMGAEALALKEFAQKGGPGSGNYGHSGLSGIHGGSSPTKNAGELPDLPFSIDDKPYIKEEFGDSYKNNKPTISDKPPSTINSNRYVITPDNKVIYSDGEKRGASHTMLYAYLGASGYEDLTEAEREFTTDNLIVTEDEDLEKIFMDKGYLSVTLHVAWGFEHGPLEALAIKTTKPIDRALVRKIERLGDKGLLTDNISGKTEIDIFRLQGNNGNHDRVTIPWEKIGMVSGFIKHPNGYLITSYKGGPGSGNYGHSGLTGVHGGSSPTKSGAGGISVAEKLEQKFRSRANMTGSPFRRINSDDVDFSNLPHGLIAGWIAPSGDIFGTTRDSGPVEFHHTHVALDILDSASVEFKGEIIPFMVNQGFVRFAVSPQAFYVDVKLPANKEVLSLVKRMLGEYSATNSQNVWASSFYTQDGKGVRTASNYAQTKWFLDVNSAEKEPSRVLAFREVSEKGGPGSGNFGHSGLAGVHGGSSPTKSISRFAKPSDFEYGEAINNAHFVSSFSDVLESYGDSTNVAVHISFITSSGGVLYGYPHADVISSALSYVGDNKAVRRMGDSLRKSGCIRLIHPLTTAGGIQVSDIGITKAQIRTLSRVLKELGQDIRFVNYEISDRGNKMLAAGESLPNLFEDLEFLQSKRTKGGPGSGNYGHSGLSGVHGGSSPTKNSDITQTSEFKKWFGDSKVVDEKGEPKVVYHGTNNDFQEFDPEYAQWNPKTFQLVSGGRAHDVLFFAANPRIASWYAQTRRAENANVMPVYLKMEKPLIANVWEQDVGAVNDLINEWYDTAKHDGLILNYTAGGEDHTTYVVWYPEQVKSAFNEGTFDPDNPNILKEVSEKGGKGSGNWGHGGLAGVHGGSSPTRTTKIDARFPGLDKVNAKSVPTESVTKRTLKVKAKDIGGGKVRGEIHDRYYQNGFFYGELSKDEALALSYYQGSLDMVKERTGLDLSRDITFIPTQDDHEYVLANEIVRKNASSMISSSQVELNKQNVDDAAKRMRELGCAISLSRETPDSYYERKYLETFIILKPIDKDGFINKDTTTHVFVNGEDKGLRYETTRVPAHQIVTHELGHVVWNKFRGKVQRWRNLWHEDKRFDRSTAYATSNAEEGFAETFVSYVYNIAGNQFIDSQDRTMQVMDEIIKDIVGSGVAQKGGPGSGNWGHQGLSGVHGGSSATVNVDSLRFPDLEYMPLMHTKPSKELIEKSRRVEYITGNTGEYKHNNCLNASKTVGPKEEHEYGVVQAVMDKIEERTGVDVLSLTGNILFVDNEGDEEMAVASGYYTNGLLERINQGDENWSEVVNVAKRANEYEDTIAFASSSSLAVVLREFWDDNIIVMGRGTGNVTTARAEHIIAHELAHILYYSVLDKEVTFYDKDGYPYYNILGLEWDTKYDFDPNFDRHTDYSSRNRAEGFAETFVSYLFNVDPAQNLEGLPESIQVIDSMFKKLEKAKDG